MVVRKIVAAPPPAVQTLPARPARSAPLFAASLPEARTVFQPARPQPVFSQKGKVTHLITFAGLQDPQKALPPAIQMKVRGVKRNQISTEPDYQSANDNINRLAASNWKDGQALTFRLKSFRSRDSRQQPSPPMVLLSDPQFGELGRVPEEIAQHILPFLTNEPQNFRFELSNMIAGTTRGAETIGLRVNLVYQEQDPKAKGKVLTAFNTVLNDDKCRDSAMLYQPVTSPEEMLKLILNHERETKGSLAAQKMEAIIDNIAAKLKDPNNKRILLIGHCKPDGDTLGCIGGLKAVIELMDPTRIVDIAVDDKTPGLFRDKVPGLNDLKRPANPGKIVEIDQQLADLRAQPQTERVRDRIESLERELAELHDPSKLLDPNAKYDLVATMDIPTPTRFSDKFKTYLDSAKEVVYIDHHPHRYGEWDAAAATTGLNIADIHRKDLAWIADSVGACAQMIGVFADKLVPGLSQLGPQMPISRMFPTAEQQQRLAKLVANLVTGMSTDTGSFTRTANLTPEDMLKPVEQRPNFRPEGFAKWLMKRTANLPTGRIDKKWLRENITYGFSEKAHDAMLEYAVRGRKVFPDLGLGFVTADYDAMNDVWQQAMDTDGAVTLLDVQNEFKYGEVMGTLKADPSRMRGGSQQPGRGSDPASLKARAKQDYRGPFDKDRIAILVCQDKKAGELDEKIQTATQNGLRLSLRSAEGSNHAEMLAGIFGGGGHGGAAGGRIDLPGVTIDSRLAIRLNNATATTDPAQILYAVRQNHATMNNPALSDLDKKQRLIPIEVTMDEQGGKTVVELIRGVVGEIRRQQAAENPPTAADNPNRPGDRKSRQGRDRNRPQ